GAAFPMWGGGGAAGQEREGKRHQWPPVPQRGWDRGSGRRPAARKPARGRPCFRVVGLIERSGGVRIGPSQVDETQVNETGITPHGLSVAGRPGRGGLASSNLAS